ncbi:ATP-grasp domain-containing protein [Sulfitobacter sp. F26169L]|uniref:carboxylate--amine ligase n=1 Tax=Sulfitobacter sp. F26169L TaxID=2996015 RepID=UPI0022608E1F|nr:ATP-grasp domain-containing protein [Sulfitobacter sp. F26169L]
MPRPDLPTAVVMGLSPTGLHIARTVKRLGACVIGIGRPGEVGLSSSVLSQKIVDDGSFDVFERLHQILGEQSAVLLPSSDEYVELIAATPRPDFLAQKSYHSGAADLLLTKSAFYEKCDELGLKYPRTLTLAPGAPRETLSKINLPILLKPSRMHEHKAMMRGKKGWVINDDAELTALWPLIASFPGELVAQEFIPGPESEIRLVCGSLRAGGEVTSLFTCRKLRQYPRGIGSASVVQSNEEPDAAEMALTFLKSIDYQGIFGAEMKKHAVTGELYFIEINPRTSLWFSVSEAAGCPVVQQSYLDVADPDGPPLGCAQQPGVRWRYWLKDKVTQAGYVFKPHPVFPKPRMSDAGPVRKRCWAVYEPADPWPAIVEPLGLGRKFLRRVFKRPSSK